MGSVFRIMWLIGITAGLAARIGCEGVWKVFSCSMAFVKLLHSVVV